LIGKESRYLSDEIPAIRTEEHTPSGTPYADAYRRFRDIAKDLTKTAGYGVIHFTQLTGSEARGWDTKYHFLPSVRASSARTSSVRTEWGIPKGGAEAGESPLTTARREFEEEVGYSLDHIPDDRFRPLIDDGSFQTFSCEIDDAERAAVESAIRDKSNDHYSELYNVHFIALSRTAASHSMKFNRMSRRAIDKFKELALSGAASSGAGTASAASGAGTASASPSSSRKWHRGRGGSRPSRGKIAASNIRMAGDIPAVGTKAQVFHGTAKHTAGGLTKSDLVQNKHGRIVSRRKMMAGKKALKYLTRKGYKARKGTFKLFRKHRSTRRQQGGFF
jgi:8-oxo-dGTP pyrophosphatase MutT (NUDIX family)